MGIVYHSGKKRAQQTAEVLGNVVGGAIEQKDGLKPNDDVEIFGKKIKAMGDGNGPGDVMLVGHLPYMGKLVGLLVNKYADDEIVKFGEVGTVCLERDAGGTWIMEWAVEPGVL